MADTSLPGYLPAAIAAVEREREQLRRERDAFEQFAAAVESITVRVDRSGGVSPVLVGAGGADGSELREVRAAYRDTVMEIDHFDQEYGEGLGENMALELTENVASAVVNGQQFSRPLKQAVIRQSQLARSRRDALLETVADERDSLEWARERLDEIGAATGGEPATADDPATADKLPASSGSTTVGESDAADERPTASDPAAVNEPPSTDRSLTELFDVERRLSRQLTQYDRLLRRRQRDIHTYEKLRSKPDYPFLQAYLYESLPVDFPVLATATERYERLRNQRQAVRRAIIYNAPDRRP